MKNYLLLREILEVWLCALALTLNPICNRCWELCSLGTESENISLKIR